MLVIASDLDLTDGASGTTISAGDKKFEEFTPYNVMTYLAFLKDEERMGRPFEAWSGALNSLA